MFQVPKHALFERKKLEKVKANQILQFLVAILAKHTRLPHTLQIPQNHLQFLWSI